MLILVHETDKAIIVKETPEGPTFALPKSQVEFVETKKVGYYEVEMPEWLAEEKGLI